MKNDALRNIAIIAHVDHGKTTLVDHMFRQSGVFRTGEEVADRVMDSMDLERERGITISAKNCSVCWNGVKINILDTPGHADFGGEVERALTMVDGAVLLVDSSEGPLPQTRFVLKKALDLRLKIIVCLNKIDRQDARPQEVLNEIYDLFIDLDADDAQIEFPLLYAVGRNGTASFERNEQGDSLAPLFETILSEVPAPVYDGEKSFQMRVASIGYSDYLGRLAIGRIHHGTTHSGENLVRFAADGKRVPLRVVKLQSYEGPHMRDVERAEPGEIVILAGIEDVQIGDTICSQEVVSPLPRISVEEPTVMMRFAVNSSPFAGREGSIVQAPRIYERLKKEMLFNVALRVEKVEHEEAFLVKGRGEFQLAILIETMRREGFELNVGRPRVLTREIDGVVQEPIEHVLVDCEEQFTGVVTEKLSCRKGRLLNIVNHGSGRVRLEFSIPARGLIGYRSEFLTDTKGTGILHSYLERYDEYRGDFPSRTTGSLVADRTGEAVPYALYNLEPRGRLFITPGTPVYEGMIVGEHSRGNDLNVNPCKTKKLTNVRAAGKDDAVVLTPVVPLSLEGAIELIRDDELVEVTPQSIRLRKARLRALDRRDTL